MSDTVELPMLVEETVTNEKPLQFSYPSIDFGTSIAGLPPKFVRANEASLRAAGVSLHVDDTLQMMGSVARVLHETGVSFVRADIAGFDHHKAQLQLVSPPIEGTLQTPTSGSLHGSPMTEPVRGTRSKDEFRAGVGYDPTVTNITMHVEQDDAGNVSVRGTLPRAELQGFGNKVTRHPYESFAWSRVDADASGQPGFRLTGEFDEGIRFDIISSD